MCNFLNDLKLRVLSTLSAVFRFLCATYMYIHFMGFTKCNKSMGIVK